MYGVTSIEEFQRVVAAFFERHPHVAQSRLGNFATNDHDLVGKIRKGRDCRLSTVTRVIEFMRQHDEAAAARATKGAR